MDDKLFEKLVIEAFRKFPSNFTVEYERSNGYNCSCCEQTWDEMEEFCNKEAMLEWFAKEELSKTDSLSDYNIWRELELKSGNRLRKSYKLTDEDKALLAEYMELIRKKEEEAKAIAKKEAQLAKKRKMLTK